MKSLKKRIASLLTAVLVLQPVFAATNEYRIPLQALGAKPTTQTGSNGTAGSGLGDITVGDSAGAPVLAFAPDKLTFDVTKADDTLRSSLLTNTGTVPAVLGVLTATASFGISSNCPVTLAPGDSCLVSATRTASAMAGATYDLSVMARGSAQTAVLELAASAPGDLSSSPYLTLDHNLVSLGDLAPGIASSASVRLTNQGGADANLRGLVSSAEFNIATDCPTNLAAGASCTITATFAAPPTATGTQTHQDLLTLKTSISDPGIPLMFYARVLGAITTAPALGFSSSAVTLGPVDVGASASKQVTLQNTGTAPAVLMPLESAPGFAVQSDCPASLPATATCTVSVTFTGAAAGTAPAYQLKAQTQDGVSTSILLQGLVNGGAAGGSSSGPVLAFTPGSMDFGTLTVGQSVSGQATLTNTGNAPATLQAATVDMGPDAFAQANDCGASLAPGASCSFTVTYHATKQGYQAGRVALAMTGGGSAILTLGGYGIQAVLTVAPSAIPYGGVTTAGTLPSKVVALGNNGNTPLTGLSIINNDHRLAIDYGNCTATLTARQGCDLVVAFTPDGDGPFSTSFQVNSSNGGSVTVPVTGAVVKLAASPSSLAFPTTTVGTSAIDQDITLTNTGQTAVTLDGISVTYGVSNFNQSNNCGSTLPSGASCTIAVRYTPQAEGPQQGGVDISAAGSLVAQVALSGTGYVPKLTLSSASLSFPETNVGKTANALSVIVSNQSNTSATFDGISIVTDAAEFAQSNNCGTGLAPGDSCTVSVQYTPTSAMTSTGSLAIASSLGTYPVTLSGQPTQPLGAIDTSAGTASTDTPITTTTTPDGVTHFAIAFPTTQVHTSSPVRSITFSNKGNGPLGIQGISVVSGTSDFSQSNNCGTAIPAGSSCTIAMLFTPSTTGGRSGTITIASDTGNYAFDLFGTGLGAIVQLYAESSTDFGTVTVGSAAQRMFTFKNTGTIAANQVGAAFSGTDTTLIANTCGTSTSPVSVAAGGSCAMTLQYAPKSSGTLTGNLVVGSDASNGSQTIGITGKATQAIGVLTADTSTDFGTVATGTATTLNFTFANNGDADATGVSAAGAGTGMTIVSNSCGVSGQPVVVPAGQVCKMTVQFTPAAQAAVSGTLTVLSSAQSSPNTLKLTGAGKYSSNNFMLEFNGANGSTAIADTGTGSAWYSYNGATQTTAVYREGTAALNLNGSNQAAYGPAISYAGDFTVSAWVRPTARPASYNTVMGQWNQGSGQGRWLLTSDSGGGLSLTWAPYSSNSPILSVAGALPLNKWTHIAFTHSGTMLKLWVNGVVAASATNGGALTAEGVPTSIGNYYNSGGTLSASSYFAGQVDDVHILTGTAATSFALSYAALSAPSTSFGSGIVGNHIAGTVAVTNNSTTPALISAVSSTGDFAVTSATACTSATLAPGASCNVSVTFTPSAQGARSGTMTVTSDATNGSMGVSLTGTGQ